MITLAEMEKEMKEAAQALEFEQAAELRDEIARIKKLLPGSGGGRKNALSKRR